MSWGTIDEAVKHYGCGRATVERRVSRDELPSYKDEKGRRLVWLAKAVDDRLAELREELLAQFAELREEVRRLRGHQVEVSGPLEDEEAMLELEELPHNEEESDLQVKVEDYEEPKASRSQPKKGPEPLRIHPSPAAIAFEYGAESFAWKAKGRPCNDWGPKPGARLHPEHLTILGQLQRLWPGSISSFEEAAEVPKGFFSSARKGKREGPKSLRSWRRIREALGKLKPRLEASVS